MKPYPRTLVLLLGSLAALWVIGQSNARAATLYNTEAEFLTVVQSSGGAYWVEDFLFGSQRDPSQPFSAIVGGVTFSYQMSAASGDLFWVTPGGRPSISSFDGSDLIITFTSHNVNAIGGDFFLTSGLGALTSGDLRVSLSDGTTVNTHLSNGNPFGFRGFVNFDGTTIDSLRLHDIDLSAYPTLTHIIVATEVPEPAVLGLVGLGAVAFWLCRRRS